MTEETFSNISVTVLVGGLIAFMAFIVWDLAKKSKAGRFGTMMLFFVLGLGVVAFLVKTVLVEFLKV
ncbi:DUF2788 domain-containing protein [Mangrovitalea sediminis]|uniref:DUF2788 domain-containing protein n=1 Tax=Mangrovitalea sediminis TaxID=1982043 RepID=UPI000BE5AC9D|nr:DUF2788 domain-containing protein [Mangrovitalea sediminis]